MTSDGKLMEMLTGYAAAHRHPFNIVIHMLGIPTIMLGVLIPLTWLSIGDGSFAFSAGVDSTLVLKVALDELGPGKVVAVTGRSDSLAQSEFEAACELAEEVGAEHQHSLQSLGRQRRIFEPNNPCQFVMPH